MTTDLRDLLEDAAVVEAPPADGFDRAVRRGRHLHRRARLLQAAALPTALLVLAAVLHGGGGPAAQVRTVSPADPVDTMVTTTTTASPTTAVTSPRVTTTTSPAVSHTVDTVWHALAPQPQGPPQQPEFMGAPPPGFRVAFNTNGSEIWTMEVDGSDKRLLLEHALEPLSWSSNHRKLLFHGYDNAGKLWVNELDVTTGQVRELVRFPDAQVWAADFSPDNQHIVYAIEKDHQDGRDASQEYRMFIADADGSHPRELPWPGELPVWSPDGTRIAFNCDRITEQTQTRICTGKADGTDLRGVRNLPGYPVSWSPDGQWLASPADQGVVVTRVDGTDSRTVGRPSHFGMRPAWTADSARVIYMRGPHAVPGTQVCFQPPCDWEQGLYSAAIDGSSDVVLTSDTLAGVPITPFK